MFARYYREVTEHEERRKREGGDEKSWQPGDGSGEKEREREREESDNRYPLPWVSVPLGNQ